MAEGLIDWRVEGKKCQPFFVQADGSEIECGWTPQPGSQQVFLDCTVQEALYEGTRGPGKTDALIMDFARHTGPDDRTDDSQIQWRGFGSEWRGILFRQTYPQLADVITKTKKWFPLMFRGIRFNESKTTWTWPTGESLRLSYGARESDYWNYHGHEYPWIGFEELTTWADPSFYKKMFSCNRCPGVPDHMLKIRSTTNPYGPGHNWVKLRFELPVPVTDVVGSIIIDKRSDVPANEHEPNRVAIHGFLDENRILLTADPTYKGRIRAAARNPAEVSAWLEGDWNIVAGGMFDDLWDEHKHVVPDFDIPSSWRIDRSFDWGSSAPFSVGWWAESDGTDLTLRDGRVCSTVRGDLFRIAEWYGWTGQPNEGLRMLAVDITKGIIERELDWKLRGRVKPGPADSSIFAAENGVSIGVDMAKSVMVNGKRYNGIQWNRADKSPGSRKAGWELVRKMFTAAAAGSPREFPGLFVCRRCDQFIRTMPVLPRDLNKDPDDVDTTAEDHIADEVRYRVRFSGQRTRGGATVGLAS
jgi:hypothetical protein